MHKTHPRTIRFGVSLPERLLHEFDGLCSRRGYENRSEAIRDLIRQSLVKEEWDEPDADVAATITLVYDHHKSDLTQRLTETQHDHHDLVVTTMHVHLDHDNCLEVLVLKGKSARVRALAERLVATKGVLFGDVSLATTGKELV